MPFSKEQQSAKIKALFIAANPADTPWLKLDEEVRAITEKIRAAEHRDLLELISIWAARPDDLLQSLNVHKPQIVHFSGHGSSTGEITLVNELGKPKEVSPEAIKALFSTLKDNVRVVIFNACYSQSQARSITEVIDCAIGMKGKVIDTAAIIFAATFYRAIGFGRSVQEAFDQGNVALLMEGISKDKLPELFCKAGINPSQIVLVAPDDPSSKEGKRLLMQGKNTLLQGDYASAIRVLEKTIEILSENDLSQELAQAKYFLALAQLKGKRPFAQTKSLMDSIQNLLLSAITLHHSYAYIITLALFKDDFALNGLQRLKIEAIKLVDEANQMIQTPEDRENIKVLSSCQPDLIRSYSSS